MADELDSGGGCCGCISAVITLGVWFGGFTLCVWLALQVLGR